MRNELVLEQVQKVAQSVISVLSERNYDDSFTMNDVRMNNDYYKGLIKGREESIKLIKKAFEIK